jgi:hypothetical protein
MRKREQVSVPLDRELREFVERAAAKEDRSVTGQIRHWVAQLQRQAVEQTGARAGIVRVGQRAGNSSTDKSDGNRRHGADQGPTRKAI